MDCKQIRNFCIIAHIDHGKSTLADRLLEFTNTISDRDMKDQVLDNMELERERGITIKAQAVRINYKGYELNLIDTPGHVDFSYEVSKSLAAAEGALLVIDAAQGIEAQTMANIYLALENDLEIIPIINKIDLDRADPKKVKEQLLEIGIDPDEAILTSAKEGTNIEDVLHAVIKRIPAPQDNQSKPLRALIFDSVYDSYQGVIAYVRVIDGKVSLNDQIKMMANDKKYEVDELGVFNPTRSSVKKLSAGEVGYIIAGVKDVKNCRVGDTITHIKNPAETPLPGYKKVKPMVYSGLYPSDNKDFNLLKDALEKLQLNDASLTFEPETSEALGFGFRCGFLGLLHMEIIQERLEREYDIDLITTAPSVIYEIVNKRGETLSIHKPQDVPDPGDIEEFRQPIVRCNVIVPGDFIGAVTKLCQERRGIQKSQEYLGADRAMLVYDIPLAEVVYDLHDKIKSCTRGYGTLDYEMVGYEPADLCRMDIMVNGKRVDALSVVCNRADADRRGRAVAKRLKAEIERHMFEVAVQAAVGSRVIARETVPAMRKNVTAKCYGGDITRKRKLLQKQKEGKN